MLSKLQYISQGTTAEMQFNNIYSALDAGCNWIQLRFKNENHPVITTLAEKVRRLCDDYRATFIINDHPDIAHMADADGVHLGLADMAIDAAREIVGHHRMIGGTANSLMDVLQRVKEGCQYVGLGPFRFTATKEKLSPVLGLQGYQHVMDALAAQQVEIPVYAIGGILPEDTQNIMQTGVYGVAVSGIITHHPDKKILVQQFNTFLYDAVNHSG